MTYGWHVTSASASMISQTKVCCTLDQLNHLWVSSRHQSFFKSFLSDSNVHWSLRTTALNHCFRLVQWYSNECSSKPRGRFIKLQTAKLYSTLKRQKALLEIKTSNPINNSYLPGSSKFT